MASRHGGAPPAPEPEPPPSLASCLSPALSQSPFPIPRQHRSLSPSCQLLSFTRLPLLCSSALPGFPPPTLSAPCPASSPSSFPPFIPSHGLLPDFAQPLAPPPPKSGGLAFWLHSCVSTLDPTSFGVLSGLAPTLRPHPSASFPPALPSPFTQPLPPFVSLPALSPPCWIPSLVDSLSKLLLPQSLAFLSPPFSPSPSLPPSALSSPSPLPCWIPSVVDSFSLPTLLPHSLAFTQDPLSLSPRPQPPSLSSPFPLTCGTPSRVDSLSQLLLPPSLDFPLDPFSPVLSPSTSTLSSSPPLPCWNPSFVDSLSKLLLPQLLALSQPPPSDLPFPSLLPPWITIIVDSFRLSALLPQSLAFPQAGLLFQPVTRPWTSPRFRHGLACPPSWTSLPTTEGHLLPSFPVGPDLQLPGAHCPQRSC